MKPMVSQTVSPTGPQRRPRLPGTRAAARARYRSEQGGRGRLGPAHPPSSLATSGRPESPRPSGSPPCAEGTDLPNYREGGLLPGPPETTAAPPLPGGRSQGRGGTYLPRAKHSSLAVAPLAVGTVSGNCTSILGSYSPMTPVNRDKELRLREGFKT